MVDRVTQRLLELRSISGRQTRRHDHLVRCCLKDLEREGLVFSGRGGRWNQSVYPDYHGWRLTEDGVAHLRRLELPETVRVTFSWYPSGEHETIELDASVADGLIRIAQPVTLVERFSEEIEAMKPLWQAEREEARAKGRREYRKWLRGFRKGETFCRLFYTKDEIEEALRAASKRGPAEFADVMDELAPGKYGREEAARVSQALVSLVQQGKAERVVVEKAKLWQTAQ